MPDVVFITPSELAAGIRLAGGDVIPARSASEVREAIATVRQQGDILLAVVPEHLVMQFEAREVRALLASHSPYFVPLPMDWRGTRDARRDLEDRIRHILGFRIILPDRTKRPRSEEPVQEEGGAR